MIIDPKDRPVYKLPQYLSPSAMNTMDRCAQLYYYTYLSQYERPEFTPGLAANIGSAFDIYVKEYLASQIGLTNDPQYWADELLKSSIPENNMERAVEVGKRLMFEYMKTPYPKDLLTYGISDMEMDIETTIKLGDKEIPVRVKPDLVLADGTVFDWKVQGAASKSGASPTPGYTSRYINGKSQKPHKFAGRYLEDIKPQWARQLVVGSWAISGIRPDKPIRAIVDNVTVNGSGTIVCTRIDTHISEQFQIDTFYEMHDAWQNVVNNTLPHASASKQVCNMFGQVCDYAHVCPAYKQMKEMQDIYG